MYYKTINGIHYKRVFSTKSIKNWGNITVKDTTKVNNLTTKLSWKKKS